MIISTIATALVQCRARTQAGWITFAGVAEACSSLIVRLDMAVSARSSYRLIRREPGFRYCLSPGQPTHGRDFSHKKASRVAPARLGASCCNNAGNAPGLRRRHQDGVDHVDHAVGLIDVRDRHARGTALGVDDHDLVARLLDGEFL